jgi:GT2 family glycosyltransferase
MSHKARSTVECQDGDASQAVDPPEASRGPRVGCIVLNWNGWQDTIACLAAIEALDYGHRFVIVVDNGSTDQSVARIQEAYPGIQLLRAERNLGFGGGVNVGIRAALQAGAEFIWLLNNDTRPAPAALGTLVRKALAQPRLGAIGSVLMYMNDETKVQAWGGGRVNCWLGRATHAKTAREDGWFHFLTAASLLLRREALEKTGLFDERFFLYWEDTDLSFRLRAAGWGLGVAADSVVLHKVSASSGGDQRKVDRHSTASGIRFLRKHAKIVWISVPLYLLSRVAQRILRGQFARTTDIAGGLRDHLHAEQPPRREPKRPRRVR